MSEAMTVRERALAGAPLEGVLVIDAHGHLGRSGRFDIPSAEPAEVVAVMDRIGIDAIAVSHMLSHSGGARRGNELLAEAIAEFPGRFLGYAVVNPNCPDEIDAELDRCFDEPGFVGIKTHIDFHDYPADGPGYWRAYEYARDHGPLPVLGHSFGDARTTEKICRAFPQVRFLYAHIGGQHHQRFPNDVIALAGELENLYLDTVFSRVPFGSLERLVETVGVGKVLYGSDMCFQSATHQIGRVLLADLPEEDKKRILGGNAAEFFRVRPGAGGKGVQPR